MSFRTEEGDVFVIEWGGLKNHEQWIKTIYRDNAGMLFLPAVPVNMERFLVSYLQQHKMDFVLSEDNHVYINVADMADLFPDRVEIIEEAKKLVEQIKPFRRENINIH